MGPARVARALTALSAPKAEEIIRFEVLKTAASAPVYGPEPHNITAIEPPRPVISEVDPKARTFAARQEAIPLPQRQPSESPRVSGLVFTKQQAAALITKWYLTSDGRDRRTLLKLYCHHVDFWGDRAMSKSAVIDQITDFADRWPVRTYKLQPRSLELAPAGHKQRFEADFTYEFRVSGGHGFGGAAGLARGRLAIERQNGRWRICAEEGQVLKRYSATSGAAAKGATYYANPQRMDTHRILFGD